MNTATMNMKQDIKINFSAVSTARVAELVLAAKSSPTYMYQNTKVHEFFMELLTMSDDQITSLKDQHNATADIDAIVSSVIAPVRDGSELSLVEIISWYAKNQDVAPYKASEVEDIPFKTLFLAMTAKQRQAAVMTPAQIKEWVEA